MLQMIWEFVADPSRPNGGDFYARRPTRRDGTHRKPDGVTWLSISQMVERTGRTMDQLQRDYRITFADLFGDEAAVLDDAVPPASMSQTTSDTAPAATLSADHPETHVPPDQLARLDLVRVMDYPEWDDVQWQMLIARAQEKRLSLLSRHVIGRLEPDPVSRKMKVVLITTIDAMRLISFRTGTDAGMDEPAWTYDEYNRPLTAKVTVHKLVGNPQIVRPVTALVHADEYAGLGISEYEEKMPKHRLAKIAEAHARRAAFPQDLGNLYAPEEFPAGPRNGGPRQFEPSVDRRPGGRDAVDEPWKDDVPEIPAHGQVKQDPLNVAYRNRRQPVGVTR